MGELNEVGGLGDLSKVPDPHEDGEVTEHGHTLPPKPDDVIEASGNGSSELLAGGANQIEMVECPHSVYRRGLLPGANYIKTCVACGRNVSIPFAEWSTISDR